MVALVGPLLGLVAAGVLLWNQAVSSRDIVLLAVMYALTGFGITVGFHRLLTHRSFAVHRATGYAFAVLGSMALQGSVRLFLFHHATFSINSICHIFGSRRFATDDRSTNVAWLAPFSLGESWHHNHHAFPRSALHGLRWWELDPSGLLIRSMARVGLAWNLVRIAPERQEQKSVA